MSLRETLAAGDVGHLADHEAIHALLNDPPDPPLSGTIEADVYTASHTLVLGNLGRAVEMNVATANTVTVPPNSSVAFPVGAVVEVCQVGAGQTTIVAGAGVTIQTPQTLVLVGQWSTVSLRQRAVDVWVLAGDVEAAA